MQEAELGQASSGAGAEEAECSSAEVDRRHARASCTGTATTAASRVSGSLDEIDHHSDIDHAPGERHARESHPPIQAPPRPPPRASAARLMRSTALQVSDTPVGNIPLFTRRNNRRRPRQRLP